MTNKDALGRLLEYTVWANHRLLELAGSLGVEDFKRDLGFSHGGVRGTLTHMMSAEWVWLERFKGVSPERMMDEGEFADFASLRERWTAVEEHREEWFRNLPEDAVSRRIAYRSMAGAPDEAPLWQLIQHVANHATHHRGQVTALLRLLGVTPVGTDLVTWDREQRAARPAPRPGR